MAEKLWGLQKRQIEALQHAKVEAIAVCEWAGRLFEAVRDNRPGWSCYAVEHLLDRRNGDRLSQSLRAVDVFVARASIPVEVPWTPMARTLSVHSMKRIPSAHRGAVTLWTALNGFLFRRLSQLCPEVGLVFDCRHAADNLVDRHWETLRRDLTDVAQFDCEGLEDAIRRESQAAMEVCNTKLISAVASPTPPAAATEQAGEKVAPTPAKAKRSTKRGEARLKLIAALTKHHKYADGGCLNQEPIGVRALARLADVDPATASAFFNREFDKGEKRDWQSTARFAGSQAG